MPLAIMLTVPFALSGVVLTFMLTGTHLNQIADLGMLILCGLVVNNGIMLVDAANQLRARGCSRTDALIQSGQQRLRPILMTMITTVAGLMPMVAPLFAPAVFGPAEAYVAFYGPIGLVVVGGLCMSTVLTLLLLPAVYALVDEGRVVARHVWHDLRR
jgi:HAE1 family hydrophobic/amphiphilic exporter-1